MQNINGLILCAKYAFAPNLLNYCGPKDNRALFEILKNEDTGAELRNLLSQLEGAVPYLKLIAQANKIEDIFDWQVVEAYWLGNDLLNKVTQKRMLFNLEERFKKEIKPKDWTWMLKESLEKAKPHHNFHTLEIYRRRGFFKSNMPKKLFENMSNCCILWGKVVEKPTNGWVIVEYEPIEFFEGKLRIGIPQNKKIQLIDPSIKQWDEVSIHWNYVCDKITQKQKERLAVWTQLHLDLTNKTL